MQHFHFSRGPVTNEASDKAVGEALEIISQGVDSSPSSSYPAAVNERLPLAREYAQAAAVRASSQELDNSARLLQQATNAPTAAKRVLWLHRAADSFARAYAPVAACAKGCSHCCHIPVKISRAEAAAIAKDIGRPHAGTPVRKGPVVASYESPCTFLKEDACSIYEHRPAVCRSHLNLDVDNLLCRLTAGADIPVPYANSRALQMGAALIGGPDLLRDWADIREWFPT